MPDLLILHGLIYIVVFSAGIFSFAFIGPRAMLHSYPPEIRNAVPPKTPAEKRLTIYAAVPFLSIFLAYPTIASVILAQRLHWHFADIFIFIYGLMFIINVYDLLILDWLMFCYITPRFVVLPGTKGNKGYKNYRFHLLGFFKGLIITLLLSLLLSAIVFYIINI